MLSFEIPLAALMMLGMRLAGVSSRLEELDPGLFNGNDGKCVDCAGARDEPDWTGA